MRYLNRDARRGLRNLIVLGSIVVVGIVGICNFIKPNTEIKALEINRTGKYEEGNNWSDFSEPAKEVLEGNSTDKEAIKEVEKKWNDTTNNIKARYGRNVKEVLPNVNINILDENTEFIKVRHREEREDVTKINDIMLVIMNSYENIFAMWKSYSLDTDNLPNEILIDEIMYNVEVIDNAYEELITLGKTLNRDRLNQVFDNLQPRRLELQTGMKDLRKGFEEGTKLYKTYGYSSLVRDRDNWLSLFDLYEY